jgi:putative peptidoglycan lipid II flippase
VNRRIFSATLTVAALTVLVKAAGAAKLIVVAHVFGTADALDAFLIAFLLPSFLAEVIGASLNSALIPTYIEVREQQGKQAAQELFSGAVALNALMLSSLAVVTLAAHRPLLRLIGSGFSASKLALADSLFLAMLPLAVLMGISTVWRAALNAGHRFALAAGAPMMTPLVTVGLLAGGARTIYTLAAGAVAGTLLEMALVGYGLKRQGIGLMPRWRGVTPALTRVLREFAPMLASALLTGGAVLIDPAMAATLGPGSVAALGYGKKLAAVILAIGPLALSTAALPHLSLMTAQGDTAGVRRTLRAYSRLLLIAGLPLTLLLVRFSDPLVRLMFQKGAFTESDTRLVAAIQSFALLQIPFAMLMAFVARLISSLKANRVLMWGALINLALTPALDYGLLRWRGVAGIALAGTVVSAVTVVYFWMALGRLLRRLQR